MVYLSGTAIAIGLALSACIAWSIGANDMANSMSVAVGSGVLRVRTAMIVFAAMLTLGAVLQGFMVMKTLGRGIVEDMDLACAISASLSAFTWIMVATLLGLPVSTSHTIASSVVGSGLGRALMLGHGSVNLRVLSTIVVSWAVSPLAAMALAVPAYFTARRALGASLSRGGRATRLAVVAMTAFSAYSFGANDVANATGVYVAAVSRYFGMPDAETMRFLSLLSAAVIASGGIVMGKKVLATLAYKITRLDILTAIAAGFAKSFTVWTFTTVPYLILGYGLPISTTYAAAGSIIGAAIARSGGVRGVSLRSVASIVFAWLLTLPVATALGFALYCLVFYLTPSLAGA